MAPERALFSIAEGLAVIGQDVARLSGARVAIEQRFQEAMVAVRAVTEAVMIEKRPPGDYHQGARPQGIRRECPAGVEWAAATQRRDQGSAFNPHHGRFAR